MANNADARGIFDSWLEPLKDLGLKRNVMDSNFTSEDGVFDGVGIPAFTTIMDYTNYDARTRHTNADFYEAVSEQRPPAVRDRHGGVRVSVRDARQADAAPAGRRAGESAARGRWGAEPGRNTTSRDPLLQSAHTAASQARQAYQGN